MKLLIHVFIDGFEHFYTENSYDALKFWDNYGACLAIDNDITEFPESNFVKPTKINGAYTVTGAKAKNYSWVVSVASFAERDSLKITKFPTIMFYDTVKGKYVARLEGAPHTGGEVANILRGLIGTTTKKATQAGLGLLAFLLLFIKKKSLLPSK